MVWVWWLLGVWLWAWRADAGLSEGCRPSGAFRGQVLVERPPTPPPHRYVAVLLPFHGRSASPSGQPCGALRYGSVLASEALRWAKRSLGRRLGSVRPLGLLFLDSCHSVDKAVRDLVNFETCTLAYGAPDPIDPDSVIAYITAGDGNLNRRVRAGLSAFRKPVLSLSEPDLALLFPPALAQPTLPYFPALVTLLGRMRVRYVGVVYSESSMGRRLLHSLRQELSGAGVCMKALAAPLLFNSSAQSLIVEQLEAKEDMAAVVLLTDPLVTEDLFVHHNLSGGVGRELVWLMLGPSAPEQLASLPKRSVVLTDDAGFAGLARSVEAEVGSGRTPSPWLAELQGCWEPGRSRPGRQAGRGPLRALKRRRPRIGACEGRAGEVDLLRARLGSDALRSAMRAYDLVSTASNGSFISPESLRDAHRKLDQAHLPSFNVSLFIKSPPDHQLSLRGWINSSLLPTFIQPFDLLPIKDFLCTRDPSSVGRAEVPRAKPTRPKARMVTVAKTAPPPTTTGRPVVAAEERREVVQVKEEDSGGRESSEERQRSVAEGRWSGLGLGRVLGHRRALWAYALSGLCGVVLVGLVAAEAATGPALCGRLTRAPRLAQSAALLSQGLLVGLCVLCAASATVALRPSALACAAESLLSSLGLTLVFGLLLTRLLLLLSARQARLLPPLYQGLFMLLLLLIQGTISLQWLLTTKTLVRSEKGEVVCTVSSVIYLKRLGFPVGVLGVVGALGVGMRDNPFNHFEASFVASLAGFLVLGWATLGAVVVAGAPGGAAGAVGAAFLQLLTAAVLLGAFFGPAKRRHVSAATPSVFLGQQRKLLSSAASAASSGPHRLSASGSPEPRSDLSFCPPPPPKVTQALRAYDEVPTLDLPKPRSQLPSHLHKRRSRASVRSLGGRDWRGAASDGEESSGSSDRRAARRLRPAHVIDIPGADYVLVPKAHLVAAQAQPRTLGHAHRWGSAADLHDRRRKRRSLPGRFQPHGQPHHRSATNIAEFQYYPGICL